MPYKTSTCPYLDDAAGNYHDAELVCKRHFKMVEEARDSLNAAEDLYAAAQRAASDKGKTLLTLLQTPPRLTLNDTGYHEIETAHWLINYLQGCGLTVVPAQL